MNIPIVVSGNSETCNRKSFTFWATEVLFSDLYTQKIVSLNQRNIPMIYGQRKNVFELKKVLLIQKNIF